MPKFPLLCVMMFLQFFVWGSWFVTAGTFVPAMQWDQSTTGWVYSAGPIAALISPLFLGLVADRFFASQRVLALLHALGGAVMLLPVPAAIAAADAAAFEWCVLAYMLCYMPTLGLSNTVAFHHLGDAEKRFPLVRVFGTLGWIAAVTLVSKGLGADTRPVMFQVAGIASLLLAGFAWLLPHTPPPAKGQPVRVGELFGLGALELLRTRGFPVFLAGSFLICIPLAGYYSYGNQFAATVWENPGYYLTFGQWAEVLFMLVMPLCFARLGVKWMLAIGMAAWVVRYGLWSAAATAAPPTAPLVLGGILLHGICYDFFFVTGQVYVDRCARRDLRGQAQGLLVLVTQGLGMLIGAQVVTALVKHHATPDGVDWSAVWLLPCVGAGLVGVGFVALFRAPRLDPPGHTA
ncbi:MAG: MFS transporter [Planctomycetes bacterium]|nr:MFS transporter [Planctomycetota bacterium]